ncbi:MAG: LOG family protein [Candidatus Omnitrophica bacterium]|nr:LOG family protein [Candidatus Omnitrophota bacterium]
MAYKFLLLTAQDMASVEKIFPFINAGDISRLFGQMAEYQAPETELNNWKMLFKLISSGDRLSRFLAVMLSENKIKYHEILEIHPLTKVYGGLKGLLEINDEQFVRAISVLSGLDSKKTGVLGIFFALDPELFGKIFSERVYSYPDKNPLDPDKTDLSNIGHPIDCYTAGLGRHVRSREMAYWMTASKLAGYKLTSVGADYYAKDSELMGSASYVDSAARFKRYYERIILGKREKKTTITELASGVQEADIPKDLTEGAINQLIASGRHEVVLRILFDSRMDEARFRKALECFMPLRKRTGSSGDSRRRNILMALFEMVKEAGKPLSVKCSAEAKFALSFYAPDMSEAAKKLKEIIALVPDDGRFWYRLGEVLTFVKKCAPEEMLEAFKRSVKLGYNVVRARYQIGNYYARESNRLLFDGDKGHEIVFRLAIGELSYVIQNAGNDGEIKKEASGAIEDMYRELWERKTERSDIFSEPDRLLKVLPELEKMLADVFAIVPDSGEFLYNSVQLYSALFERNIQHRLKLKEALIKLFLSGKGYFDDISHLEKIARMYVEDGEYEIARKIVIASYKAYEKHEDFQDYKVNLSLISDVVEAAELEAVISPESSRVVPEKKGAEVDTVLRDAFYAFIGEPGTGMHENIVARYAESLVKWARTAPGLRESATATPKWNKDNGMLGKDGVTLTPEVFACIAAKFRGWKVITNEDGYKKLLGVLDNICRAAGVDALSADSYTHTGEGFEESESTDWRDLSILAKAAEITADETESYGKAKKIFEWVGENINYSFDLDRLASASVVLKTGYGSCGNIANLTASLLRASGVPARFVIENEDKNWYRQFADDVSYGIIGSENKAEHAWAEALVDDKWFILDQFWSSLEERNTNAPKNKNEHIMSLFDGWIKKHAVSDLNVNFRRSLTEKFYRHFYPLWDGRYRPVKEIVRISTGDMPRNRAPQESFFSCPPDKLTAELKMERERAREINSGWDLDHSGWPPAVTVFGSARISPDDPIFKAAEELGEILFEEGFAVRTGAGPAIMEAPLKGWIRARDRKRWGKENRGLTQGINISLDNEQVANGYAEDRYEFRHFDARKMALCDNSEGMIAFPGGFGTIDELFEVMARRHTVVLYGKSFWQPIVDTLFDRFKEYGIFLGDYQKPFITDSVTEAVDHIRKNRGSFVVSSEEAVKDANDELEKGMNELSGWGPAVTFIGESKSGRVELNTAVKLAKRLSAEGVPIRSGERGSLLWALAAPELGFEEKGILQAMLYAPKTVPPNIKETALKYCILSQHAANHHVLIAENSKAFVFLPGGPDTMDTLFDIITAMQNNKIPVRPIVLIGRNFWEPIKKVITEKMYSYHPALITHGDERLMQIVDSADEAYELLRNGASGKQTLAGRNCHYDFDKGRERLIAVRFRDAVIDAADKEKNDGDNTIILGLDESWIPTKNGGLQGLLGALDEMPALLKKYGYGNLVFVRGKGDKVAEAVLQEQKRTNAKFSNVIVLGGKGIFDSDQFKKLKSDNDPKDMALLVGVDGRELTGESGIRLLEMYLVALRLAGITSERFGPAQSATEYIKVNPHAGDWGRAFELMPVKPFDISESKAVYDLQVKELDRQA